MTEIQELIKIINETRDNALFSGDGIRRPWIVELPMNDEEYDRFNELLQKLSED